MRTGVRGNWGLAASVASGYPLGRERGVSPV